MDTGRTWALLVAVAVAVAVVVAGCSSDRKVTPPAPTTTTWHRLAPQHFELLVVGPSGQVVKTGQGLQSDGPPVPGPLVFF